MKWILNECVNLIVLKGYCINIDTAINCQKRVIKWTVDDITAVLDQLEIHLAVSPLKLFITP